MNRRGGFTLIELLIVIAILAIMSGAAIVAYEDVQARAEMAMAEHQLSVVRDALLHFRNDMGYFPGEGPLAPAALNLSGFYYVDGASPTTASPGLPVRQRWAAHPMNLWMLFEKPIGRENPTQWDWCPTSARGWRGPYLGNGKGASVDAAGTLGGGFRAGATSDRLYAVPDLIQRGNDADTFLKWVTENVPVTEPQLPEKSPHHSLGSPIAFIIDTSTMRMIPATQTTPMVPLTVIYKLVSAGADGVFQTVSPTRAGDDLMIEVTRRTIQL